MKPTITPWKGKRGKIKEKLKKGISTPEYSYSVTHPSANPAEHYLTLLDNCPCGIVGSLGYSGTAFALFYISNPRKSNKWRKKIIDTCWGKLRTEKKLEGWKWELLLLWWSDKRYFLYGKIVKVQYFSAWSQVNHRLLTLIDNQFSSTFSCIPHFSVYLSLFRQSAIFHT